MTVDRLQPKMRDAALFKWKDVAWNGIRFTAPEKWEAAKIGARHLLLEEAARPTMELKWRRIRGKFSHHKLLRRLAALHPDRLPADLAEWDLPPQWQSALVNFNASGFRWHGKAFRGRGVILYCPACQTATLIQFYHRNGSENDPVCHQVLGSFRDHFQGEPTMWSLFDIRACLPSRFELTSFRFDAGHFFLKFAARGQTPGSQPLGARFDSAVRQGPAATCQGAEPSSFRGGPDAADGRRSPNRRSKRTFSQTLVSDLDETGDQAGFSTISSLAPGG